jgi:choline dehydrogenase
MSNPKLTIVTHAQVSRVLFEGKVACGIEWIENGETKISFCK